MSSSAWSALADRFAAVARFGETALHVTPSGDGYVGWPHDALFEYRLAGPPGEPTAWAALRTTGQNLRAVYPDRHPFRSGFRPCD